LRDIETRLLLTTEPKTKDTQKHTKYPQLNLNQQSLVHL